MNDGMFKFMKRHVSVLGEEISCYFPNQPTEFWKYRGFINDPFEITVRDLPSEGNLIQEQLIDSVNDGRAKHIFRWACCSDFWIVTSQFHPGTESEQSIPNNLRAWGYFSYSPSKCRNRIRRVDDSGVTRGLSQGGKAWLKGVH